MSDTSTIETPGDPAEAAPERLPRPRIRTGAVIWGLLLAASACGVLWIASTPARRADALEALLGLDGFGWTVVVVVALGGLVTLLALAAVIRRLQRRRVSATR